MHSTNHQVDYTVMETKRVFSSKGDHKGSPLQYIQCHRCISHQTNRGTVIKKGHGWQASETLGYRGLLLF